MKPPKYGDDLRMFSDALDSMGSCMSGVGDHGLADMAWRLQKAVDNRRGELQQPPDPAIQVPGAGAPQTPHHPFCDVRTTDTHEQFVARCNCPWFLTFPMTDAGAQAAEQAVESHQAEHPAAPSADPAWLTELLEAAKADAVDSEYDAEHAIRFALPVMEVQLRKQIATSELHPASRSTSVADAASRHPEAM